MTTSLLDYADSVGLVSSPIPPATVRRSRLVAGFRTRGAFPVDTLPADALAIDLARRGVTFQRGSGYARNGFYMEADQVARLGVDVLSEVVDALPVARVATLTEWSAEIDRDVEHAYFATIEDDSISYDDLGTALTAATGFAGDALTTALYNHPLDPEEDDRVESERWGLRYTVTDLRASASARRRLLDSVRPHLPAPLHETHDEESAEVFLASFDARLVVRRSELAVLYSEANAPGDLTRPELRAAADKRWGTPGKRNGHYLYHPSAAPRSMPEDAAPASANPFPYGVRPAIRLAAEYATAANALHGELPQAEALAALFTLSIDDAHTALAAATPGN